MRPRHAEGSRQVIGAPPQLHTLESEAYRTRLPGRQVRADGSAQEGLCARSQRAPNGSRELPAGKDVEGEENQTSEPSTSEPKERHGIYPRASDEHHAHTREAPAELTHRFVFGQVPRQRARIDHGSRSRALPHESQEAVPGARGGHREGVDFHLTQGPVHLGGVRKNRHQGHIFEKDIP